VCEKAWKVNMPAGEERGYEVSPQFYRNRLSPLKHLDYCTCYTVIWQHVSAFDWSSSVHEPTKICRVMHF
jgi:hypothetical protein